MALRDPNFHCRLYRSYRARLVILSAHLTHTGAEDQYLAYAACASHP